MGKGIQSTLGQLRTTIKIAIGLLIFASLVTAWHALSRYADNYNKTHLHIGESLQQVLPKTDMVEIDYNTDEQDWSGFYNGSSVATVGSQWKTLCIKNNWLDEKTLPGILALLKSSKGFHAAPPPPQGGGFVLFFWVGQEEDSPPHPLVYIPQTGELGSGHDWCYVPAKFKAWMQAQALYHLNLPAEDTSVTGTTVVASPLKSEGRRQSSMSYISSKTTTFLLLGVAGAIMGSVIGAEACYLFQPLVLPPSTNARHIHISTTFWHQELSQDINAGFV